MTDLASLRHVLRHNDWANQELLRAACILDEALLDRPIDVGPGSLRRTLMHILNGEQVWLRRCRGESETPWPDESQKPALGALAEHFAKHVAERDRFLDGLDAARLSREQVYRDSKGSLFRATLGDELFQALHHSIHHRAQAVNIVRRLGGAAPELDYMMWLRQPA